MSKRFVTPYDRLPCLLNVYFVFDIFVLLISIKHVVEARQKLSTTKCGTSAKQHRRVKVIGLDWKQRLIRQLQVFSTQQQQQQQQKGLE